MGLQRIKAGRGLPGQCDRSRQGLVIGTERYALIHSRGWADIRLGNPCLAPIPRWMSHLTAARKLGDRIQRGVLEGGILRCHQQY
jgi:hypothetical protein